MKKHKFTELLRELILDQLREVNVTGAVGPTQTPFAFSKGKKDSRAVSAMKSFGYTKAERPKRPSNTKLFDFR